MAIEDKLDKENINEEILAVVRAIEDELPNGTISEIQRELKGVKGDVKDMGGKVDSLCEDVEDLTDSIRNPQNGLIVTTNKNSQFREENEEKMDKLDGLFNWKSNVNKALWLIGTTLLGLAARLIYTGIS